MAPSKLSKKPAMKTIAKVAKNSMKATKKPAAPEGPTQDQPKLKVWDMVLHCTKPNCGSWIFQRKIGWQDQCVLCGQPWATSFDQGGSMLWHQLPQNQMAKHHKKAKEIQNTKDKTTKQGTSKAMKAMKVMKAMKAMNAKMPMAKKK